MADDDWVRVGRVSFVRRMRLAALGLGAFLLPYIGWTLGPQLTLGMLRDLPFWLRATVALLVGFAVVTVILAIIAARSPGLLIRRDGRTVRIRGRVEPAEALDGARLLTDKASGPRNDLVLELAAGSRRTRLWLRSRDVILLDDEERTVLVAALERSAVAPPASSFDPSGRFARYNFPGSLTRDEVVGLVRRIPARGERLPVTD
jgi:hypothetical protein